MFLALGLIVSAIAYFVTNEGMSSVIQIMLCAFLLDYMFSKKTLIMKKKSHLPSQNIFLINMVTSERHQRSEGN